MTAASNREHNRDRGQGRDWKRILRGALVVTGLSALLTGGLAALPSRPEPTLLDSGAVVADQTVPYWVVALALLVVADQLVESGRVDRSTLRFGGVGVFGGVLVVHVAIARLRGVATDADALVTAVGSALFATALFVGTTLAAVKLLAADDAATLPVAGAGVQHDGAPSAARELFRALTGAALLAVALGVVETLATVADPYVVLRIVEAGMMALGSLFDYLVVGVALGALLTGGSTIQRLAAGGVGVLAGTFVLGIGVGLVGALAGVAVVGATVTPIEAVESATLVNWPDPLAGDVLVAAGTVVAAGLGFRTIRGSPAHNWRADVVDSGTAPDSSDQSTTTSGSADT